MDVVLAVIVFAAITVAITVFALFDEPETRTLEQNAQVISSYLSANQIAGCEVAISQGVLSDDAMSCLFAAEYERLKEEMNLQGDFCIHLEDEDGRIIPVNDARGVGSSSILISGIPCGQ